MKEKEVNKNKKKMSKGTLLWVAVLLLIPIIVFIYQYPKIKDFGTSGIFEQTEVEMAAKEIITLFGNQEYEVILEEHAGEQLKKSAIASDFAQAYLGVAEDWGALQEIGLIQLSEMKRPGGIYALAKAQVIHENVIVNYTLSFGKDMKFEGIYLEDAVQE